MDLNSMLRRHPRSLMFADRPLSPRHKRAHAQFARDYAEQIRSTRAALGARRTPPGSVT
jgi:hypothetical protein